MAARLIALPFRPTINLQGGIEPGAILEVYETGTLTPVSIYSDSGLTTPLSNPLTANGAGVFPPIYWDDATTIRIILKDASGTALPGGDVDPYIATAFEAEAILEDAAEQATAAGVQATAAAASALAAASSATAASTSATAAAASAASAVLSPGTSGTVADFLTIGITPSLAFGIEAGKHFSPGQYVFIVRTANVKFWMFGQILSYNSGTGAMTVDVEDTNGSGTHFGWTVSLSGPPGSVGTIDINSGTTGTLAIASGGTGSTTAADARTALGLGTIATQAASSVSITGGSITGITDLAVADGGTGASTAANARTNLGLGTIATQAANSVSLTGGTISGMTSIADSAGNVRNIVKSGETSGTLTAASANGLVRAVGGVTIPNSVFAANNSVMIVNKSGGSITITQGSGLTLTDTSGATGNRTLANHGVATVWFNTASDAIIFGAGLS